VKADVGRYFGAVLGRPGRSLTRRLIWLAAAWIVGALVVTSMVLVSVVQETSLRRMGTALSNTLDEVIAVTQVEGDLVITPQIQDARTLRLFSGKYWAVAEEAPDGRLRTVLRSRSLWDSDMPTPDSTLGRLRDAQGQIVSFNAEGPSGEPLRVAATMKSLPGREAPLVFMAALDRSNIDADTRQFATVTMAALALLGLGLVTAVFIQVRIGLRPLYELRDEIADVRKGVSARIMRPYPIEIAPLADQLNRLLDDNQEVVERQRTHVGNLAHALKTPLAVMLAEAGSAKGVLPDTVRRQTEVMKLQVDHHLRRARAAARAQVSTERTSVAETLDEMAVMLERVFQSRNVEIDWRAPDDLWFRGERQDFQEILGNVLENACIWAKRRIRVSAGADGMGRMILVVEDDGPGLPADRREEVLKRGARLDESAPGSGLGLSIVEELTRAYDGRLMLGESEAGGLKVTLELPAAEV
jgi:signal transduction histidine kinase